MDKVFLLFGRSPLDPNTKTRLAADIGPEYAREIYRCFIKDLLINIDQQVPFRIYFYLSNFENDEKSYFSSLFEELDINPEKFILREQVDGKFFERIKQAVKELNDENPNTFFYLTGTDVPDFPFHLIDFQNTENEKSYLGEDEDGGFYFFASHSKNFKVFNFHEDKRKSVSQNLYEYGIKLGLNIYTLPKWSDVDTLEDLKNLHVRSGKKSLFHTISFIQDKRIL